MTTLAGPAAAASLTSLVGGGSLSTADVTVNGFSYNDVGGGFGDVAVPASSVDVSISSTANTVRLRYAFDPQIALSADDVFEINGGFTVNVGSSRMLTQVAYDLSAFSRTGDAFVEVGSSTFGGLTVFANNSGTQLFDSEAVAPPAGSLAFLWDAQGEAFDASSSATLGAFDITFTLDQDFTPTGAVPVPAALPLLASGVLALGLFGRRRRRG